jgi:hypothetical protein
VLQVETTKWSEETRERTEKGFMTRAIDAYKSSILRKLVKKGERG